ncbi:nudix hydrolase 15, mitochondrial isoform X1 [Selaginella moellendorffii]|uniref:nudix hydrolase 15, mitochondrial isoform X1 n=1 Tax=Selaginella moellendorffii TaxID=88036 RepID=UPI000D1C395A|nr:nudix hydrolase 15, mitochondrial isoform X1 [Selaginella moellendorffii]|eukprot:XP_024520282.1 nudix hydrolase 15, mitochondrial isoform X1 [Selaginella moellendorffii]
MWRECSASVMRSPSRLTVRSCHSVDSMDDREWGSARLQDVARRLCKFKVPTGVYGNLMQFPPPPGIEESSSIGRPKSRELLFAGEVEKFPWRQRAGVLICLFLDQEMDLLKVILTKRTSSLSSHSGEVALPGGKWDEGDEDEVSTALREAREEIGLDPSLVKVVTQLEPFISKLLVRVVPVIALLPHRQKFVPRINPDEVASMFEAPLEMFLKVSFDAFLSSLHGNTALLSGREPSHGRENFSRDFPSCPLLRLRLQWRTPPHLGCNSDHPHTCRFSCLRSWT